MSSSQELSQSRRRSTVYDLAALQLHPDGKRRKPRNNRSTRDSRGNWIANDAAGSSKIKRNLYTFPKDSQHHQRESEGEEFDFDEADKLESSGDLETPAEKIKSKRRRTVSDTAALPFSGSRAAKRRRFVQDYSYLEESRAPPSSNYPSAELLKIIHRFSSQYYSERGLLLNATQEVRRQKKERKLRFRAESLQRSQSVQFMQSEELDITIDDDGEVEMDHDADEVKVKKPRGEQIKDMYKSLDGSALLALGMLTQLHISRLTKNLVEQRIFVTQEGAPAI